MEKQSQPERGLVHKINISYDANISYFMWVCKNWFHKRETIELHAIGSATETAVHTAESLCRNDYAVIDEIKIEEASNDRDRR